MEQIINSLPIAVYVAILLFILKEFFEFIRKGNSKRRKKSAFKLLLSKEIEINHWVFYQIFSSLKELNDILNNLEKDFPNPEFKIINKSNGDLEFLRKLDVSENRYSGHIIPVINTDVFNKSFIEIAELDQNFFEIISNTYTQIAELNHIRNGIIEYINDENNKEYLANFSDYALNKKEEIFQEMEKLYKYCTNDNLRNFKLR